MYAVIEAGGKQYRVEVGTELEVDLIDAAIQYANDCFEENELAAARRALGARRNHMRLST